MATKMPQINRKKNGKILSNVNDVNVPQSVASIKFACVRFILVYSRINLNALFSHSWKQPISMMACRTFLKRDSRGELVLISYEIMFETEEDQYLSLCWRKFPLKIESSSCVDRRLQHMYTYTYIYNYRYKYHERMYVMSGCHGSLNFQFSNSFHERDASLLRSREKCSAIVVSIGFVGKFNNKHT